MFRFDARHTSQTCPACARIQSKTLSQREHDRPYAHNDDRDHASALVILERGLKKLRSERPDLMLVDRRPLLLGNERQVDWLKQETSSVRAG